MEDQLDHLDNLMRKNNIRIDGVTEMHNESQEQTEDIVKAKLHSQLNIPQDEVRDMNIIQAHRAGRSKQGEPRTIIVSFSKYKHSREVLRRARKNKPRNTKFYEDFTPKVSQKRKELIPQMLDARRQGKIAFLVADRLVVKDRPPIQDRQPASPIHSDSQHDRGAENRNGPDRDTSIPGAGIDN